jgi:hypothetical protein
MMRCALLSLAISFALSFGAYAATVVQALGCNDTDASCSADFSSNLTSGNTVLVWCDADSQSCTGATLEGNAMNMDYQPAAQFTLTGALCLDVTASGWNTVTANFAGTTNHRFVAIEVNGLASGCVEDATSETDYAGTGEGSAVSHSIELTTGAASEFGFAFCATNTSRTFDGTNSATEVHANTGMTAPNAQAGLYKDALPSGATTITFDLDIANSASCTAIAYPTSGGGGGGMLLQRRRRAQLRPDIEWRQRRRAALVQTDRRLAGF